MTTEKILRMIYLMRQSSRDTLPDEDQREMFVLIAESIHGDPILPSQETEIKIKEGEKMKTSRPSIIPFMEKALDEIYRFLREARKTQPNAVDPSIWCERAMGVIADENEAIKKESAPSTKETE